MYFSAAEKDRGVKFCMRVRLGLLSGQVFSHFGEIWLAGSHGGGITSGVVGIGHRGAEALLKAVWWDLRLASLLTHLLPPPHTEGYLVYCFFVFFFCHFVCHFVCTVTDFSAAEKARGMKFCQRVGLLS